MASINHVAEAVRDCLKFRPCPGSSPVAMADLAQVLLRHWYGRADLTPEQVHLAVDTLLEIWRSEPPSFEDAAAQSAAASDPRYWNNPRSF